MIAPRELPAEYAAFNRRYHAPLGRLGRVPRRRWSRFGPAARWVGPFAWQENSSTRQFEYPFAHARVAALGPETHVVEVGAGLSGLQFVLAREGQHVLAVDPAAAGGGPWPLDRDLHARLCRHLRAPVYLVGTTLPDADLPEHSAEAVVCISTLEHLEPADADAFAAAVARALVPGGIAVLTVDLFLDLAPFSERASDEVGRNVDIRALLEHAGLELAEGDLAELHGFPEFDPEAVSTNRERYLVAEHRPVLSQCLVATPRV